MHSLCVSLSPLSNGELENVTGPLDEFLALHVAEVVGRDGSYLQDLVTLTQTRRSDTARCHLQRST